MFLRNWATVGFSLFLPHCLCMPNKFSRASWLSFSLRKLFTTSISNKYRISSKNEETASKACSKHVGMHIQRHYLPVILMPCSVMLLSTICFLSSGSQSFRSLTLLFQWSRYINSSLKNCVGKHENTQVLLLANLTVNLKSLGPRYGCRNGFLLLLPAEYEDTLKQSKNLSNFAMKYEVSQPSPPLSCIALDT